MEEILEILKDPATQAKFDQLKPEDQIAWAWRANWIAKAHIYQVVPAGDWWSIWLMLAGRGAGKTRTAAEQVGWWAWTEPGTRWLVGAPTSSDVRATCFEGDSGLLSVIPSALVADYNRAFHELKLTNGSLIKGIPASEPERFRGPQFHGAWCDELAAWDYLDEAWDQIMFSVRLGKKTKIICTTTPRPKDLIIELVGRNGDDVIVRTASTYDNLANLSANFQKQILQYEGTNLGRQEIYAEIIDPEESGIVKREMFKLWPDGKPFPKFEYIIQSYDCAYTEKTINDPTACITWGVFKPQDGAMSVMVVDCWQDRLQYPDLRPKVIEEYETIYGEGKDRKRVDLILVEDKSSGISLIQDLQRAHLPVRAYNPGNADKVQRLNIVSNIIARGRVWIPESTVRKGYVRDWAEPFVSQICSFPESTHDDFVDACLDSLTQVQMANGTKPIKDIEVGDMVMTPNGLRRVTAVHDNGYKEVWKVMVNGKEILATAEHRIMTDKGWLRVDCLTQAVDNAHIIKGGWIWHFQSAMLVWKQLSSMANDITDTLKARIRRIADTFQGLAPACIGMFGSFTTDQSQMECTSTTSMATRPITTSATLPVLAEKSIGRFISMNCRPEAKAQSSWPTWNKSGQKLANGTDQRKAGHGIENTPKSLWPRLMGSLETFQKLTSNVFGAAQKLRPEARKDYFADRPAKPPSLSSASVSLVSNTHTMRHVFDLTVEGEHCYFANGILVHNCTQALRFLRDSGWLEIDPPREDYYDEEDAIDAGIRKRENPYAV